VSIVYIFQLPLEYVFGDKGLSFMMTVLATEDLPVHVVAVLYNAASLATSGSFRTIAFSYRIGRTSVLVVEFMPQKQCH